MMHRVFDYLHRSFHALQEAPEARKRRWLMGGSLVAAMLVVWIWLAYFNTLIAPPYAPPPPQPSTADDFSLWQSVRSGTAFLFDNVSREMSRALELLRAPKNYEIVP